MAEKKDDIWMWLLGGGALVALLAMFGIKKPDDGAGAGPAVSSCNKCSLDK